MELNGGACRIVLDGGIPIGHIFLGFCSQRAVQRQTLLQLFAQAL